MNLHDLIEYLPGARNSIKFVNLKKGEEVLLVCPTDSDEMEVHAVTIAVEEAGGIPSVIYVKPPTLSKTARTGTLMEAQCAADVVLSLGAFTDKHVQLLEYLTREMAIIVGSLKSSGARFPLEVFYAIGRKVFDQVQQEDGTEIRLTSPGGTDIAAEIWREQAGGGFGLIQGMVPGEFLVFPPGVFCIDPPKNINGKAVFESYSGFGQLSKPMQFTIEDTYVTHVGGGWEADALKMQWKGIKDANYVCEIEFGMNPKAEVDLTQGWKGRVANGIISLAQRSPRTLHIGTGDHKFMGSPKRVVGVSDSYPPGKGKTLHMDGIMAFPTLIVGGETVIDRGNLTALKDPKVIEVASKYGEPDRVLAYESCTV